MKKYNRTEHQSKILVEVGRVWKRVIAFKIKKNSKVVVIRDEKIVKIKPEDEEKSI